MKNSLVVLIAVLVIVAGGIYALTVLNNPSRSSTSEENTNKPGESSSVNSDNLPDMGGSGYVEYSREALDNAENTRRVLFFYANWCPTCLPTDTDLKASVDKIPSDVRVIRVNYNDTDTDQEEKDLAKKYGITYQHTFVQIDSQGNEVAKWNGGKTEELLNKIK